MAPDNAFLQLQEFVNKNRVEYEQLQKELKETDVLIRQTSDEVSKVSERNAQFVNKVRQVEANVASFSSKDVKNLYSLAQETQMRMFTVRSRLEQLQSKRVALEQQLRQLHNFIEMTEPILDSELVQEEGTTSTGQPTITRIIEAQESERQRLARQMHDGPAQSLTNLILQSEICERLFDNDPTQARIELANLKKAVNSTFQKTRNFIFDLRPMMLDDLGLAPTLRRYVQDFEEKHNIKTDINIAGAGQRFAPYVEITVFRVIQELLANANQHSHANDIQINLDLGDVIVADVEDDGSGFNVDEVLQPGKQQKALGLAAMKERIEMLSGRMQIESSIGRGTKVTLEIPGAPPPAEELQIL